MVLTQEMWDNWISALESGDYAQVRSKFLHYADERKLGDADGYCCLSVGAKVMGLKSFPNIDNFAPELRMLITPDVYRDCMGMNDYDNRSFVEIAAYLRTYQIIDGEPCSKQEATNV